MQKPMLVCFEVLYYCGMPFCLTSSIASAPSTSIVYTRMQSTLFFHKVCHVYFHPRKCFVLWTPDTSCAVACRKGLCLLPPPLYPSLIYSQLLPCCCQLSSKLKSLVSPCITSAMVPMRCLARF